MQTELNKALKGIKVENLTKNDKEELLRFFSATKDNTIRNCIALFFADLQYNEAVPYIIKKINDKSLFNYTGTLIYALGNLDSQKYFLTFIKVICEHEYESRLGAYDIVEKYTGKISNITRQKALIILEDHKLKEREKENTKYENSKLHFIEATINLLT